MRFLNVYLLDVRLLRSKTYNILNLKSGVFTLKIHQKPNSSR